MNSALDQMFNSLLTVRLKARYSSFAVVTVRQLPHGDREVLITDMYNVTTTIPIDLQYIKMFIWDNSIINDLASDIYGRWWALREKILREVVNYLGQRVTLEDDNITSVQFLIEDNFVIYIVYSIYGTFEVKLPEQMFELAMNDNWPLDRIVYQVQNHFHLQVSDKILTLKDKSKLITYISDRIRLSDHRIKAVSIVPGVAPLTMNDYIVMVSFPNGQKTFYLYDSDLKYVMTNKLYFPHLIHKLTSGLEGELP